jgi:nucleotide-binding universal stress UspA family protein
MLERILVPLDGSELADRIVNPLTALLAKSSDVSLITVVPSAVLPQDHAPGHNPLTIARKHLGLRRDELTEKGVCAHTRLAIGDPASKVLEWAKEHGATLIVMATHGRTGADRLIRGSTAERVLRHSPVPVLVANPKALEASEELRFKKILVPLDGSERSAEIIPDVIELARVHGSEVVLFYGIPIDVQLEPWAAAGPIMTQADGEKLLEPFQARFHDVPVRRVVALGAPGISILSVAEDEKVDLIAMTTHGRTGASRWFFGSVAEQVTRHATCPLLVKRTAGPPLEAKKQSEAVATAAH